MADTTESKIKHQDIGSSCRIIYKVASERGEAVFLVVMGVMMVGGMILMAVAGGHHMFGGHDGHGNPAPVASPATAGATESDHPVGGDRHVPSREISPQHGHTSEGTAP